MLCIQIIGGNAKFRIDQDFSVYILPVELLSHSCQKNNREFQSFALMDTHDPHGVIFLSHCGRLAEIGIIFLEIFNISDKMEQPLVAGLLIFRRFLHQHIQVRPPGLSCRHRRDIIIIAGFLIQPVNQLMDRQIGSKPTKLLQLFKKAIQTFPAHSSCVYATVLPFICAASVICHHLCQFPVTHANHR